MQAPPPPRWADRFLSWFCAPHFLEEIQGDLYECYYAEIQSHGIKKARNRFILRVLLFCRPSNLATFSIPFPMFKNYLLIAWRNIIRQRGFTALNILGLSVGLACSILILLWVQREYNTERWYPEHEDLYRVKVHFRFSGEDIQTWQTVPYPATAVMETEIPSVKHAMMLSFPADHLITQGDKQGFKETVIYADTNYFRVSGVELVAGDTASALDDLKSIVVSEKLAAKLGGKAADGYASLMGELLRMEDARDVLITGVFEDLPPESQWEYEAILNFDERLTRHKWDQSWGNFNNPMVVRLKPGSDVEKANQEIANLIMNNNPWYEEAGEFANQVTMFLQPIGDIYLRNKYENAQPVGGRITYVKIFALVSIFLLLIACINFMNLATARSGQRAREIGVRKAVGAHRISLIGQFLMEAFLLTIFSTLLALGLVAVSLPWFNELMGKELSLNLASPAMWMGLGGLVVITSLLAGSYPAFFLSSFRIVQVLKGAVSSKGGAPLLRKGLVVFQFVLSMILISGTLVIYRQLSFMQEKDLGLNKDNLIMQFVEGKARQQYQTLKSELTAHPAIQEITSSNENPLEIGNSTFSVSWEGKDPEKEIIFHNIMTDYNFVETMGIEMVAGRTPSPEFGTDTAGYLINEAAARVMGFEEPVGQMINVWGDDGPVLGVMADFHIASLYQAIDPVVFKMSPQGESVLYVRPAPGKEKEAIAHMEKVYSEINPAFPFEYRFLDERYEEMYESEQTLSSLANVFALVAIFISCLGLLGLAAYTAERRTREIGIRKVLGASVSEIMVLLSRDFTILVLLATIIAIPLSLWAANQWLESFEFTASIPWWIYALAGVAGLGIAWLTVSYQALRAARANPIEALKDE